MNQVEKLNRANVTLGNLALNVMRRAKKRVETEMVCERLFKAVTRAGGYITAIAHGMDNNDTYDCALIELNTCRYVAELMYSEKLCADRYLRKFLKAADELEAMIGEPIVEEVKPDKKQKSKEPVKEVKRRKNEDEDGFDDFV